MSEKQLENLYTFMDDSLGNHESRFLLKSLDHDEKLRARWMRFHYCRVVLQEPCQVDASLLSLRISEALVNEPLPVSAAVRRAPGWLKPVAGMTVAASVAIGAFAWLQLSQPQIQPGNTIADSNTTTIGTTVPTKGFEVPNQATPASSAGWEPKLQNYLMRHSQVSGSSQARNLMPYVHIISTPPPEPARIDPSQVDERLLPIQAETNRPKP